MITAQLNQPSPLLAVSEWLQGEPVNLDQLIGNVVLVEVFQVNCPGCFLAALPQAIELHQNYVEQGLVVLGVATAFEDFDINTLENLHRLLQNDEVVGATKSMLSQKGHLTDDRLPYRIPFAVAMDRLHKREQEVTEQDVTAFIQQRLSSFDQQSETYRHKLQQQVAAYLNTLEYRAETFESFGLNGTPSQILIDKQGLLRKIHFGIDPDLEKQVQKLLIE